MTANLTHFTAWLVNDPSCLDQDCMDVTVLEDELISEGPNGEIREADWASNGPQVFYAVTTVNAREGDAQDGTDEAKDLLSEAGWTVTGKWAPTDNAYTVTVERDADAHDGIEVGDRVILPLNFIPADWSRAGEVVEVSSQTIVVHLDDGHRQELPTDEVTRTA